MSNHILILRSKKDDVIIDRLYFCAFCSFFNGNIRFCTLDAAERLCIMYKQKRDFAALSHLVSR